MAEPLPPEGYITIKDAYDTFHFGWIGSPPELASGYGPEHAAFAKKSDAARNYFAENLDRVAYGGKIVSPSGSIHEITNKTFDRATFADLLPLHNAIPAGTSGPLSNYVGGIVCFKGDWYFDWLKSELHAHLHGEIQNGELEPQQANERLKSLNLAPLQEMPPIEEFRDAVMREIYWTLPMAVAWIAWRNVDNVVKLYPPYAQQGGHWSKSRVPNQTNLGFVWENAREPSLSGLMFYEAAETYHANPPRHFIKESREQLWRELQAGNVTAIGIEDGGSHKPIASVRWASLEVQAELTGRESIGASTFGGNERIHDVRLPSKEMLRLWPLAGNPKDTTPNFPTSQMVLPEHIVAWLELETSRATDSLRTTFELIGRQKNAVGKYKSGEHIANLIDAFKATCLALADMSFQHAQSEKLDSKSIEVLSLRVMAFAQSAKQCLDAQIAKVERKPAVRTQHEIISRISRVEDELEAVCNIALLKARSSLVIPSDIGSDSRTRSITPSELLPTLTESELEQVYLLRVQHWPADTNPPSRDDDFAFLKTKSQQVTREMARSIRGKNAPESWVSQGRRAARKLAN